MQRYNLGNRFWRDKNDIRYIGGVGEFDVFWVGESRRMIVKWVEVYGATCPVAEDGAEDIWPLKGINKRLAVRRGPKMTKEEHTVLRAMRKLFVVE